LAGKDDRANKLAHVDKAIESNRMGVARASGFADANRIVPVEVRRRRRRFNFPRRGPLVYVAALGPGLIAANAGNDAGGIATYSQVGASYGYSLLWLVVAITLALALVQEMCARLGIVTGKGLSSLIREEFGIRLTTFAMVTLLVANAGTAISEFVGIGLALRLVGLSSLIGVPLIAALLWVLVVHGSYQRLELIFLAMTLAFLAYPVSALLAHPHWDQVARSIVLPSFRFNGAYIFTCVATVGTTITPYMQVYVQSSVVDKNMTPHDYSYARIDAYGGALFSNLIAGFIIICTGATLFTRHVPIQLADDAARALAPVAGQYAPIVFGVGLFGASILAAAVLPLATSYSLTEAFGLERGVDRHWADAPMFWGIFTGLIALGAAVGALIPRDAVLILLLVVQVINGVLLPVLLVFIIRLANRRALMGRYVNGPVYNGLAWATVLSVAALSALMVAATVLPWLGLHTFGS